jgi:nucleoside-diphosphate-sugar epimerase
LKTWKSWPDFKVFGVFVNNRSLLIVGCGDIGHRVGNILLSDNSHVSAVRRKPHDPDSQFHWIGADYSCPGSLDFMEQLRPYVVLATFTPSSMDTSGYRRGFTDAAVNVVRGLGKHRPRLVIMVSSTRVYAEASGGWVDESSALSTVDDRAVAIIEAEQHFLASDFPGTVVRFGGIYSSSQGRLLEKVRRGEIAPAEPLRYTNRIHRDDCAGFLVHLLAMSLRGDHLEPVYNGVDNCPAPAHQVESWIAKALDCPVHKDTGKVIKPATAHKRCRNDLLQATGYSLIYPDYIAGYEEIRRNPLLP